MKKFWLLGITCALATVSSTADAQQYSQPRMNGRLDTRLINYQDEMELEPEAAASTSQRVSQQLKSEYGSGPTLAPPMSMSQSQGYVDPGYGHGNLPPGNAAQNYTPQPHSYAPQGYPGNGGMSGADCGCNGQGSYQGGYADAGCGTGDCGCGAMGGAGCGCNTGNGRISGRHDRYIGRGRDRFIGGGCNSGGCGVRGGYGYDDCGNGAMGYDAMAYGDGAYRDAGYGDAGYGDAGCGVGYTDAYGGNYRRGGREMARYDAGYGNASGGRGLGILDRGCDVYTVVGGGWLLMKRDGADFQPLSYENGMPTVQLSTSDANIGAQSGMEAFFARQSNDGRGWEMRYWGLTESDNSATLGNMPRTEFGGLSSITVGAYGSAWGIYNAADTHRISRESDLHNAEFNFLRYASSCSSRGNIVYRGIAGLRVLRFNDSMSYTAEGAGYFGSYGFNSIKLHSSIANTMIAAQVGGTGEYCLSDRIRLAFGSKVGIGGNSMDADQCLVSSNGIFGQNTSGNDYSYTNSQSDFAMFGEFNTNIYYHLTDSCRISVGYRLFGVSGVGLAHQQLPYDFTDTNEINSINRDGGLLLQGLTLGAEFCR